MHRAFITLLLIVVIKSYGFAQIELPAKVYPFNFKYLGYAAQDLIVNDTIVPTYQASKYYYINSYTGKKILSQGFEEAYPFYNGFGLVKINGKYGIIKKSGQMAVEAVYTSFQVSLPRPSISFGFQKNFNLIEGVLSDKDYFDGEPVIREYPAIKKGRYFYLLDTSRTDIPLIYDDFAAPKDFWKYNGLYALKNGLFWYYFNKGTLLFKNKNKPLSFTDDVFIYKTRGLYNIINNKGVTVLSKNYKWIAANGHVAINLNNEVVLLNRLKSEILYFPKN
ncbi:MAG: WG repeat-containing protein [Mucilaginibacter sp.]|jgi:hypothetical protein|uniref:WG repeat-containing protein n=1 Tax=Mucilaginibacter sp. TaxID=1882438 RepID=UPI003568090D